MEAGDLTALLALAAALGWGSGMRLYAVVFLTGLAGQQGWVALPPGLQLLQSPAMLGASAVLLGLEFFADKIPLVDSAWDAVHTVIRVPAGAALAWQVFGGDQATWAAVAALLGGGLAATAHVAKATARAAINTSPEPFSNLLASVAGDVLVPLLLWLAWTHPLAAAAVLAALALGAVVLTVLLFRFVLALARRLRERFDRAPARAPGSAA